MVLLTSVDILNSICLLMLFMMYRIVSSVMFLVFRIMKISSTYLE
jgi:hypothetical protein